MAQQPAAVVTAFNQAVNSGQLDAALALFAEEAVAQFPGQPTPNTLHGRAAIRDWLEEDIRSGIAVEVSDQRADGERVVWTALISLAAGRAEGAAPTSGLAEALVRDGQIIQFSYTVSTDPTA